jgi:hypothetical protein
MILGSIEGLNRLHVQLQPFLASEQRVIRVSADVSGSPEPHEELLPTLEIEKTEGPIYVYLSSDRALKITGRPENLVLYVEFFRFRDDEDGSHHHPEHVKGRAISSRERSRSSLRPIPSTSRSCEVRANPALKTDSSQAVFVRSLWVA